MAALCKRAFRTGSPAPSALPTPDRPRDSLRMLNCGFDLPPERGSPGAFGELVNLGVDPAIGFSTVLDLASLDRGAAELHLEQLGSARGQGTGAAADALRPAESFLVLSAEMARKASTWMSLASWEFAVPTGTTGSTPRLPGRPRRLRRRPAGAEGSEGSGRAGDTHLDRPPCRRTPGETGLSLSDRRLRSGERRRPGLVHLRRRRSGAEPSPLPRRRQPRCERPRSRSGRPSDRRSGRD